MPDTVSQQAGDVAAQAGRSPSAISPGIFSIVRNVPESVIILYRPDDCIEGACRVNDPGILQNQVQYLRIAAKQER